MITAKDIMSTDLITVKKDTDIKTLSNLFIDKKINSVPVVDDEGKLIGIVSETDLVYQDASLHIPTVFSIFDSIFYLQSSKHFKEDLNKITGSKVKDIMTNKVLSIKENESIYDIASIITEKKFYSIPVVDDNNKLKGIVSRFDIIKSMTDKNIK
jgi:CBS-domain-containing membrane protein